MKPRNVGRREGFIVCALLSVAFFAFASRAPKEEPLSREQIRVLETYGFAPIILKSDPTPEIVKVPDPYPVKEIVRIKVKGDPYPVDRLVELPVDCPPVGPVALDAEVEAVVVRDMAAGAINLTATGNGWSLTDSRKLRKGEIEVIVSPESRPPRFRKDWWVDAMKAGDSWGVTTGPSLQGRKWGARLGAGLLFDVPSRAELVDYEFVSLTGDTEPVLSVGISRRF